MARFNALRDALEDDTVSDEALDFVADSYADPTTRLLRSGRASPEVEAFLTRQNEIQDRRDAERAVKTASGLPPVKAQEDVAQEGVPAYLRPSNWVTARSSPLGLSQSKLSGEQVGSLGVVPVPPPESNFASLLGPYYKEVDESALPPVGIRLPVEASPMMTTPSVPSVSAVSRGTAPAVKTPEASPIPVANASTRVDATAPTTSVLPPTGPKTPAGKPDSSDKDGMVAPSSEGAGSDALGRLSIGQALTRALEGSGSIIAGRDLRSGAADTLGERMKQIEALRAKREEQSLEQQRERATWGTSNRATLASFLAQYKDKPEVVEALRALEPAADKSKQSDFLKNVIGALTTPPKVKGLEAGVAKTEAGTGQTLERTATDVATRPDKVGKLAADTELAKARTAKVYKDMELAGAKLALDERRVIEQAEQSRDPFKKLQSLNTIADEKGFGGFTTLAGDLADLEGVAPGFVTRGEVPEWLTREQQLLGQNWPTSTDPRVVDFLAAYSKVANEERHRQYGSAQTDGELRAFMQQLNSSPLSAGPQVLAQQVKRFGQAAGRVAKGRLTRYNNVFGAENVDTVLGPEWKKLFDTGGVFAGQGTPFVAPRPAAGGEAPAPMGGVAEAAPAVGAGKTALWDAARNKWMQIPNDKVDAAVSSGKYRRTR